MSAGGQSRARKVCTPFAPKMAFALRPSMPPALFVEFGFEALRRPRLGILVARIAPWTRLSRAAAGAGAVALPRSIGMAFTNPAAVLAKGAFHSENIPELVFGER